MKIVICCKGKSKASWKMETFNRSRLPVLELPITIFRLMCFAKTRKEKTMRMLIALKLARTIFLRSVEMCIQNALTTMQVRTATDLTATKVLKWGADTWWPPKRQGVTNNQPITNRRTTYRTNRIRTIRWLWRAQTHKEGQDSITYRRFRARWACFSCLNSRCLRPLQELQQWRCPLRVRATRKEIWLVKATRTISTLARLTLNSSSTCSSRYKSRALITLWATSVTQAQVRTHPTATTTTEAVHQTTSFWSKVRKSFTRLQAEKSQSKRCETLLRWRAQKPVLQTERPFNNNNNTERNR